MSSKIIPFNPTPMTSYYRSIVTIGLSRTISEINGDFRHRQFFLYSVYLQPPLKGVSRGIGQRRRGQKKLIWLYDGATRWSKKFYFKIDVAVLLQYLLVTDSQPASQPRCRSKYRAYVYVTRVKIGPTMFVCGPPLPDTRNWTSLRVYVYDIANKLK